METPGEVRNLIDQLGQALVQAIMADEAGQDIIRQIQETGFDVGLMLHATVALHPKTHDEDDLLGGPFDETAPARSCFFQDTLFENEHKDHDWSEDDKALMRSFRISLE